MPGLSVEPLRTQRLELVALDPEAIRALIAGRRDEAEKVVGLRLPAEFPTQGDLEGFLPIQLHRMETSPQRREWMARLMVTSSDGAVGHCGFHGPPEAVGRAEIGYTVFTPFRGRGYAKEAARGLIQWAFGQGEREVYASVSPTNAPSLAVVKAVGFTQVGTQEDEVDGLELVFVIRAR
ncbi:MAG TPA: GNAT family N-acetyltransferase [Candidatus Dormibacteraeota bacterium]|nr:GNAT family N-acetyltransferase [Candidatus Dormibacteraeota bacterium]